jgi:hypothetical protein
LEGLHSKYTGSSPVLTTKLFFGGLKNILYLCVTKRRYNMRINTNLNTLTHKEIRHIVVKTMDYCQSKFGVSKKKGYPKVIVKVQSKNDDILSYGEYCPDSHTIVVFKNNCKNVNDLIETTLHEYTHTLQPVKSKYYKMLKKYGYNNHPMEIEAVENEKYSKEVWKLIK